MSYKRLGNYIRQVNVRNKDLETEILLGVSITKKLIPSIANVVGTDMSVYKIIEKRQFAYGTVTSRNGEKISIALSDQYDKALVSQIYVVFEVIDIEELLPEYLMMWFSRPEFDRYVRFHSHGSTRETFDWADMCEVELPIPYIEEQRQIVAQYQSIANKIKVNEQICEKLEATAQALYKHWFVDFEFPVSHCEERGTSDEAIPALVAEERSLYATAQKGYKSSGEKKVWNEELGKEIPEGWEVGKIKDFAKIKNGYAFKSDWWEEKGLPVIKIGSIQNGYVQLKELGFISDVHKLNNINKGDYGDIVIAMTGATIGKIGLIIGDFKEYLINQRVGLFNLINKYYKSYLYFSLCQDWFNYEIQNVGGDSAQANVSDKQILDISILKPNEEIIKNYHNYCKDVIKMILIISSQNEKLTQLQSLLLSRLAVGEEEKVL